MTGDIREQLSAALDEAEKIAKAAIESEPDSTGVWVLNTELWGPMVEDTGPVALPVVHDEGRPTEGQAAHIARWDPATVLRLIERDRQLLADHQPVMVNLPSGNSVVEAERCTGCSMYPGDWKHPIPCPEIARAADFWLGTPEVDR